jgi:hypothetical protein
LGGGCGGGKTLLGIGEVGYNGEFGCCGLGVGGVPTLGVVAERP